MAFGGETAESYYDEGITASMKGDLRKAIEHFQRAAELDNTYSAAYHQLGKCYLRLGKPQKAASMLAEVVRARPNQLPPRVDLAYALLDLRKTDEARKLFNEVAAQRPDNTRAQLGLAFCAFYEKQWDAAANLAQAVVAQGKANFTAFFLLGRAAKRASQYDLEIEAFKRADALLEKSIEASPKQPDGYYLRGEIRFFGENYVDALENYRLAQEHAGDQQHFSSFGEHFSPAHILARIGESLEKLDRKEAAAEVAKQLRAVAPKHPLVLRLDPQD